MTLDRPLNKVQKLSERSDTCLTWVLLQRFVSLQLRSCSFGVLWSTLLAPLVHTRSTPFIKKFGIPLQGYEQQDSVTSNFATRSTFSALQGL